MRHKRPFSFDSVFCLALPARGHLPSKGAVPAMINTLPLLAASPVARVLTGAFMISFSAIWVALAGVEPTASAFYRVFFGFLFLLTAKVATGERCPEVGRLLPPAIFCGLMFALDLFFWHGAIRYIGPGLATIIGNFQVFLMAACGILFFGERLTLRYLLSLPLAIFGLFLVIGFNWSELPADYRTGIILGLLTAVSYTVFLLQFRKIQAANHETSRFSPLMLVSMTTAVFLGVSMVATGTSFAIPTVKGLLSLLCLGLFSQAVGWLLIGGSLAKIPPSFAGLILLLQPALAFIWDVLLFGRPTAASHWLGTVITLWAIYLGLTGAKKRKCWRTS